MVSLLWQRVGRHNSNLYKAQIPVSNTIPKITFPAGLGLRSGTNKRATCLWPQERSNRWMWKTDPHHLGIQVRKIDSYLYPLFAKQHMLQLPNITHDQDLFVFRNGLEDWREILNWDFSVLLLWKDMLKKGFVTHLQAMAHQHAVSVRPYGRTRIFLYAWNPCYPQFYSQ